MGECLLNKVILVSSRRRNDDAVRDNPAPLSARKIWVRPETTEGYVFGGAYEFLRTMLALRGELIVIPTFNEEYSKMLNKTLAAIYAVPYIPRKADTWLDANLKSIFVYAFRSFAMAHLRFCPSHNGAQDTSGGIDE